MRLTFVVRSMFLVLCVALLSNAHAEDKTLADAISERGFSYFLGIGREEVKYEETSTNPQTPVRSSVTAASPLLITGALYAVNDRFLFSMTNETTFYPSEATERWYATGANFAGTAVTTNQLLQTNSFTLSQSNTAMLAHYRLLGALFAVAGPSFRTQSFKRYAFQPTSQVGTIEESTSEAVVNVGLAFESEQVRGVDGHFGLRLTAGVPVWRRVRNTSVPDLEFTSAKGWDAAVEGRYSRAVYRGIHLGVWGKWMVSERDAELIKLSGGGSSEVPDARLENRSVGIEFLWKL